MIEDLLSELAGKVFHVGGDAASMTSDGDVEAIGPGQMVQIFGLTARSDLNACMGVPSDFDAAQVRWKVDIQGHAGTKLIKSRDLMQPF